MRQRDVNIAWCTVFLHTVSKTCPASAMQGDQHEREKHHWWKAKKWAFFNLNRLFIRYDYPKFLSIGELALTWWFQTRQPCQPRQGRRSACFRQGLHCEHCSRNSQALPPRDREMGRQNLLAQPALSFIHSGFPRRVSPSKGDVGTPEASPYQPGHSLRLPCPLPYRGGCRAIRG